MKYLFIVSIIFMISCSGEQNRPVEEGVPPKEEVKRIETQQSEEVTPQTLSSQNWKVDIVLDNGKINDESDWKNNNLSFTNDGKFVWKGSDYKAEGSYLLDVEKGIISLESENEEITSQWSIKYRASMMVWIGSPKYGHQAYQLKLVGVNQ